MWATSDIQLMKPSCKARQSIEFKDFSLKHLKTTKRNKHRTIKSSQLIRLLPPQLLRLWLNLQIAPRVDGQRHTAARKPPSLQSHCWKTEKLPSETYVFSQIPEKLHGCKALNQNERSNVLSVSWLRAQTKGFRPTRFHKKNNDCHMSHLYGVAFAHGPIKPPVTTLIKLNHLLKHLGNNLT